MRDDTASGTSAQGGCNDTHSPVACRALTSPPTCTRIEITAIGLGAALPPQTDCAHPAHTRRGAGVAGPHHALRVASRSQARDLPVLRYGLDERQPRSFRVFHWC